MEKKELMETLMLYFKLTTGASYLLLVPTPTEDFIRAEDAGKRAS